ncbi:MAG TPA: tetratricopeptide repeat protein [Thermoanaerobaculia bacterium]|jgi:tetratricopeptide (TPR) repeat protein|nr:tetratricopeptide repeat protein [Thermoanaerobaculia bacterium]
MSDGAFPDRLAQLKTRWEADPSSRVFLQLAEEYRHQGRIKEALAVLDKGLQEHPGYLSALVAKGRCHLELGEGEAARNVLERVVKQDATQMVANKLLVRAYLDTAEPGKARERLDLYSLLNDSDPEIADLRRQIKAMERPTEQPMPQLPEDSPFDLGPVGVAPAAPAPDEDIFGLGLGPTSAPPPRRETEDIFSFDEAPMATPAADDDLLFPEVSASALRQRYLASLASEGIFEIGPVPEPASAVPIPAATQAPFAMAPIAPPALIPEEPPLPEIQDALDVVEVEEVADTSWLEEVPAPAPAPAEPVFDFESVSEPLPAPPPPAAAPVEEAADLWPELEPLPEPEPEPEPGRAQEPSTTATLGELYLRQGHLDEAERIFREVLERDPYNAAAQAGLGRIDEARRPPEPEPEPEPEPAVVQSAPEPLDARRLLAGFEPGTAGGGITARKIYLLSRYLNRIRGGQPDVR